jgi:hypothetical protein
MDVEVSEEDGVGVRKVVDAHSTEHMNGRSDRRDHGHFLIADRESVVDPRVDEHRVAVRGGVDGGLDLRVGPGGVDDEHALRRSAVRGSAEEECSGPERE